MIRKPRNNWTEEEIRSLLSLVEEHPDNLMEAFRIHAINTGRQARSIAAYFRLYRKKHNLPVYEYKKWTKAEQKDLLNLLEEHPNNFAEAFRLHAEKTGRSTVSVENFFHRYRRKEDARVCMITIGAKKRSSPNRKNIYERTGGNISITKKSKWRRILDILFE